MCRRTCSKAAVGHQTNVEVDVAGEAFSTQGLMITETNWLDVYPWEKWGGNANLPHFQVTSPGAVQAGKHSPRQPCGHSSRQHVISLPVSLRATDRYSLQSLNVLIPSLF